METRGIKLLFIIHITLIIGAAFSLLAVIIHLEIRHILFKICFHFL